MSRARGVDEILKDKFYYTEKIIVYEKNFEEKIYLNTSKTRFENPIFTGKYKTTHQTMIINIPA